MKIKDSGMKKDGPGNRDLILNILYSGFLSRKKIVLNIDLFLI